MPRKINQQRNNQNDVDQIEHLVAVWIKKKIISKYPQIHKDGLTGLQLGLIVLKISKDEFEMPWLTTETIAELLVEVFDIPTTTELGITRAFAKAGGSDKSRNPIIPKKQSGSIYYKLSQPGEIAVNVILGSGLLKVLYLQPNSHENAREGLQGFVQKLKGKELKISDPYYGLNTLNVLEEIIRGKKKVKFISHTTNENITKLKIELRYLQKHYPKMIDVRIYPINELHDRYIISDDAFVIIGNGIKDLGNKESLVLVVNDRLGKDTRKELEKAFWKRWQDPSCRLL